MDFETLERKQSKNRSEHEAKEKMLHHIDRQLINQSAKKDTSAQLLQQARLAATENVEALRADLVQNEPCPVCGSKDHPYSEYSPQLKNVLDMLESTHRSNEEAYLSTLRQHSSLDQECRILQQTIRRQNEDIDTKKSILETKKTVWEQFNMAEESDAIPDGEKADWIEAKLNTLKVGQIGLRTRIQAHTDQKQQLEADKNKLDRLKDTINDLTDQTKETKMALALYREQQTAQNKENERATKALKEMEEELSPYFIVPDWMENWRTEPAPFIESINTFAMKWKGNLEKLEHNNRRQGIIEAMLNEFEGQAKNLVAEVARKADAYTLQEKNYGELHQQRNAIFGGRSAEDVETQLKQTLTEAQQQLDGHKGKYHQLTIHLTKVNA